MMPIPVANVYYLLCYAWNEFSPSGLTEVAAEQFPDALHLFAHLLASGIRNLHRSGLETGYISRDEVSSTIRGRLLLAPSLPLFVSGPHRVVCSFDELTPDILTNQILRTTLTRVLAEVSLEKEVRAELRSAERLLSGVRVIQLDRRVFHDARLHRNNRLYAFLLNICRFFYESLEPLEGGREWQFQDPTREPERMRRIFEKFVRNFYERRQNDYKVSKDRFDWVGEALHGSNFDLLPVMETDVTLRSPTRTIIIECKYTEALYETRFFAEKFRPAHLYQLCAYLRNLDTSVVRGKPRGILLYPVADRGVPAQSYELQGHEILIRTVSLQRPWWSIERDLLDVITCSAEASMVFHAECEEGLLG